MFSIFTGVFQHLQTKKLFLCSRFFHINSFIRAANGRFIESSVINWKGAFLLKTNHSII